MGILQVAFSAFAQEFTLNRGEYPAGVPLNPCLKNLNVKGVGGFMRAHIPVAVDPPTWKTRPTNFNWRNGLSSEWFGPWESG